MTHVTQCIRCKRYIPLETTGESEDLFIYSGYNHKDQTREMQRFVLCKECEAELRGFLQAEDPEKNEEEETEDMTEKEHYIMITRSDDANYHHIDVMLEMTPEDLINKINANSIDADKAWFWVKDVHGNKIYLRYSELWAIVRPKKDGEMEE